ncbi:MAG: accessory factor UbiK family protein [Pseudomonadota bacterium]
MLKNTEKVLDDIARVAGGTVSAFSGLSQNVREEIKSHIEDIAARMDLVPREDLTALELRVEALEKALEEKKKK